MSFTKGQSIGFVIAVCLLLGASLPLRHVIAPDWRVTTLDSKRAPLQGVTVREVWQDYSTDVESHEEDRITDGTGEAHFPPRTYRSSLLGRFLGCARSVVDTGVHASCGAYAFLVAFGPGIDTMDWQNPGQEQAGISAKQHSVLVCTKSFARGLSR